MNHFGQRRIYYNNFAEHLLNRFNPNTTSQSTSTGNNDNAARWAAMSVDVAATCRRRCR